MKRLALALVLALTATAGVAPAAADTQPFWIGAVDDQAGAIGPEAMELRGAWLAWQEARTELRAANAPHELSRTVDPALLPRVRTYIPEVERWRPLVAENFFPEDVPWAMRVLHCESTGDPDAKNPRSTASGLFQHLASLWPKRSVAAGWAGADVFDPEANVAVAAWLYYLDGPSHWVCR